MVAVAFVDSPSESASTSSALPSVLSSAGVPSIESGDPFCSSQVSAGPSSEPMVQFLFLPIKNHLHSISRLRGRHRQVVFPELLQGVHFPSCCSRHLLLLRYPCSSCSSSISRLRRGPYQQCQSRDTPMYNEPLVIPSGIFCCLCFLIPALWLSSIGSVGFEERGVLVRSLS